MTELSSTARCCRKERARNQIHAIKAVYGHHDEGCDAGHGGEAGAPGKAPAQAYKKEKVRWPSAGLSCCCSPLSLQ